MSGIALSEVHAASCLCGQVRLRVHGAPSRVGLCHCLDCRKAHAAAFVAFVIFPTLNVDITDPEGRALADDRLGSFSRDGQYLRFSARRVGPTSMVEAKEQTTSFTLDLSTRRISGNPPMRLGPSAARGGSGTFR